VAGFGVVTSPDPMPPLPPDRSYRLVVVMALLIATIAAIVGSMVGAVVVFVLVNWC
jgi:hypothetical protein